MSFLVLCPVSIQLWAFMKLNWCWFLMWRISQPLFLSFWFVVLLFPYFYNTELLWPLSPILYFPHYCIAFVRQSSKICPSSPGNSQILACLDKKWNTAKHKSRGPKNEDLVPIWTGVRGVTLEKSINCSKVQFSQLKIRHTISLGSFEIYHLMIPWFLFYCCSLQLQ